MSTTSTPPAPHAANPRHRPSLSQRRSRPGEVLFKLALQFCLLVAFAFLVALIAFAVIKGWNRLDPRLWQEMPTGAASRVARAGVQSAITGTLWVIGLTAAICLPIGIASAIYLEEYADNTRWYNRLLELNIQNLAGVPSIVFGILGLGLIARVIGLGFTVITAAIVLSLLVLPVVIIASREALRAVPRSIRQASYALGATRWQTTWRQVLPAAVPGMSTGAILALSRALGEAAPLILLGAVTFIRFNPDSLLSSYTTLPIQIYNLIKEPQAEFQELAAAAIVLLLVILLVLNSAAILIRNKFQKRW
ncbi:phosphate ABC transporter permease PstA [Micromonospora sp. STR1_7]|uniref:Phosphate transport system permease protein PstA n=1 Tax=Micromonospora parastrephiae TaxID=2806101 RepID=A0ABS1XMF8_9ACTN|nr:phosphate ABC transporter permease PstA [Micromonospora parastrephiae]MBM0230413.1 phosphate ABC transporter permease PstA [Micromonospora parastrephiae]